MTTQKGQHRKIFNWGSENVQMMGVLGPGKSTVRVTYLSLRIYPKKLILKSIFPLEVAATFLKGSRKATIVV